VHAAEQQPEPRAAQLPGCDQPARDRLPPPERLIEHPTTLTGAVIVRRRFGEVRVAAAQRPRNSTDAGLDGRR
jgi:hypothetical protein